MGLGYHDLHVQINKQSNYIVELHLEIPGDKTLKEAHDLADEFEKRVKTNWERITRVITHLEPLSKNLLSPETVQDPELYEQIQGIITSRFPDITILDISTNYLDGHLGIVLQLGMDAGLPLTAAHARIEEVERHLYLQFRNLEHVIIHLEPVESISS